MSALPQNMAAGYHEFTYDDGDKYRGDWNAEGKRHGNGVVCMIGYEN